MRRLIVLSVLAIFFVVFLTPILTQKSFADAYVDSLDKFKIKIDLTGKRWELGSAKESTDSRGNKLQYIQIYDAEEAADTLLILQLSELTDVEIDDWFQKHTERFLMVYGHGAHSVDERKEISVTLGSNHVVKSVRYDLTVEGDRREVRFVYFFSTDGSMQCFIFIYNDGLYKKMDQEVKTILNGISLVE